MGVHQLGLAVFLVCTARVVYCQGQGYPSCTTTECPPGSKCVDYDGFITCECPPGKAGPEFNCTLDDPCLEKTVDCPAKMRCFGPCNPNVVCHGAMGTPMCSGCMEGWTGPICDQCQGAQCNSTNEKPQVQKTKDESGSSPITHSLLLLASSLCLLFTAR